MDNVTSQAQQGAVSLKSTQTATLFHRRSRTYRTGVTVDNVDALGFSAPALEGVSVFELSTCPVSGEVLVFLVNDGPSPILISEGDTIATVSFSDQVAGPRPDLELNADDLNDIVKFGWEHKETGPIEVVAAKDSEMGKALMEALEADDDLSAADIAAAQCDDERLADDEASE